MAKLLLGARADAQKTDQTGSTAPQIADLFGQGGIRGQLRAFIETYKPTQKLV